MTSLLCRHAWWPSGSFSSLPIISQALAREFLRLREFWAVISEHSSSSLHISARFPKMQIRHSVWQSCLCSPKTCIWKGNSLCLVLKLSMILQRCYRDKLVLSTTERERDECFNQKNKEKTHVFISNRVNGENLLFLIKKWKIKSYC